MHLAEAGEGRPIVMLHGWPQHWYLWRRVVPRLAPQTRVLCPDLREFGWTEVPGRGYDRETMDRDVLALLDELELDRVDLVGHDWGGWIGFLLALRWPERIGRSVALTIAPPWPSGDRRGVLEAWRIAYQIPLALPQLGRRAVEHGLARLALRAGFDAFSEGEIEAFTDRPKG
jgi:pimeloyl-ACP methyl ester carboxylesterase